MNAFRRIAVGLCVAAGLLPGARASTWALRDGDNIAELVGTVSSGDTIALYTGTYKVHGLAVNKGVAIVAKSGCDVTIDLQSQAAGLVLNHADAKLKGCRVVNCCEYAVTVKAGAQVVDCEFVGAKGVTGGSYDCFTLVDGTIRGCTFRNFSEVSAGSFVKVKGGRMTDFRIDTVDGCQVGLDVSGSAVVSNGVLNAVGSRALCQGGGLVSHVVVTNCGILQTSVSELAHLSGGTLRNCLIAGNRSSDCVGLRLDGGHAESCTVVADGSVLVMTDGSATNCVFFSTAAASVDRPGCLVTGGAVGHCWLGQKGRDTPCFKSVGGWDFVPARGSPLIGKGLGQPWMAGAEDLAGQRRIRGRRPDIGAFEGAPVGFLMYFE